MPMNAPPEYYAALDKVDEATTPEEKLRWLLEAYRLLPKHKGTENERKLLTQRIAKLKKEIQTRKKVSKKPVTVEKEGEFQIVLFGFPNVGKSTFIKNFTGKDIKVAPYPFTTIKPEVATINYKGAKIQLVELPGYKQNYEGEYINILRGADVIGLCIDFTLDWKLQFETLKSFLNEYKIFFGERDRKLSIEKRPTGGIEIRGENLLEISKEELIEILNAYGIKNALITIYKKCGLEDILEILERAERKNTIIICTKGEPYEKLPLPIFIPKNYDEKEVKELIKICGYIEVYLKPPKKEVSEEPTIIKKGTTIEELSEKVIHKKPKQARLYNKNRICVSNDYILEDGDIVEFIV
jgi:ribosome-interacting GTPase 1